MFQFTQPKRAATLSPRTAWKMRGCFNSRSPSGLRHYGYSQQQHYHQFQFTQPKRAATQGLCHCQRHDSRFNSRSPSGLRLHFHYVCPHSLSFNSRSPSGLRHEQVQSLPLHPRVSIHAAQAGCDGLQILSLHR